MSRGKLLTIARASLFRSQANAVSIVAANGRMTDTIVSLCKAYKDWQSEHGLYLGDVAEIPKHLKGGQLTTTERRWLRGFIQRWNAACDRERASAIAA